MFFATTAIPPEVGLQKRLTSLHIGEWISEDMFRFKWWLLLFLITAALAVWLLLVHRTCRREVWLFAVLTAIISMGINEYGEELVLWDYPVGIIPVFPPMSSINLIYLPLIYSLLYQYFKPWKTYAAAVLAATGVFCFIAEPLFSLAGYYRLLHWNYLFNYVVFASMALGIKAAVSKAEAVANRGG